MRHSAAETLNLRAPSAFGVLVTVLSATAAACGGGESAIEGSTGTASASLSAVPAGIQCVVLTLSGVEQGRRQFSVTPGATPVVLDIGLLPIGELTVEGAAYDQACSRVRNRTEPRYASPAQSVVVRENFESSIELVLRTYIPATVTVDFQTTVVEVTGGGRSTYARLADGTVIAWGLNDESQLGDGTTTDALSPVQVLGLSNTKQVVAGQRHACALVEGSGTPLCWGSNLFGQLGRNLSPSTVFRGPTPQPIVQQMTITNGQSRSVEYTSLSANRRHTCGISTGTNDNPQVRCWGSNDNGQVRENSSLPFYTAPILANCSLDTEFVITGPSGNVFGEGEVTRFGGVITPGSDAIVRRDCSNSLDSIWRTFNGLTASDGALGDFYATCLVRDVDGSLWCWDIGSFGPDWFQRSDISGVVDVASNGANVCALLGDGRVFCRGTSGISLGAGESFGATSTFGFVEARISNVVQLTAGAGHFCALDGEGAVWCWGRNDFGQLGDGTTFDRAIPVRAQL